MSFILDALKRNASDQAAGAIPSLHTQAAMVAVNKPRDWSGPLMFSSAFALLVASVLYLQPWSLTLPESQQAVSPQTEPPQIVSQGQSPIRLLGKIDYQQYAKRSKLAVPVAAPELKPQPVVAPIVPEISTQQAAVETVQLAEAETPTETISPELKALFDQIVRESEPESAVEVEPAAVQQVATEPVEPVKPQILPLTRKPLSFQDQIPALQFQTHLYSSDPDKRWIKVNQQELREGEWLNPALQLIAIQPDQLIFEYQGESFSLPALTDW